MAHHDVAAAATRATAAAVAVSVHTLIWGGALVVTGLVVLVT